MQELVRGYHRDGGQLRCAIKIVFVNWVKQCFCTAKYSVVINGSLEGGFQGERGSIPGDPISPYLLLIVMGAFSTLTALQSGFGSLHYHPRCRRLNLHHMVFADDIFILRGDTTPSFIFFVQLLKDFYSLSGLKPNMAKSSTFFAGFHCNSAVPWRGSSINSVSLFNVQEYWSSIFIIPSKEIKEIEGTLMAYLWSGFCLSILLQRLQQMGAGF